ncbi:hypothetical protein BH09VER1_BH09VER1_27500 [soil metagenome]
MKTARNHRGMSLLIVLAFIVIVSVLVVGFAESMRLLRPAAASHLERARADQYAWTGVERVIGTLNQQTADTNRNWITQPGQLIVGSLTDDAATSVDERKVLTNVIPLYSGPAVASADPILAPPNLNVVTYRDPNSHLITEKLGTSGTALPMQVGWVYIRKNGDIDTNASPAISTNEIVGRYAYWTDDESSKINDNIAWGRTGNTNPPGDPTRIELTALTNFTQGYADTMRKFITNVPANTPYNFFNTPLDARRVDKVAGGSGIAAALNQNKFDVTHFNSDPNTTFFGEPRIVLTTHPSLAGWTNLGTISSPNWVGVNGKSWANGGQPRYIRILADPEDISMDPGGGYGTNIDTNRLSEAIATLAYMPRSSTNVGGYLLRTDWPMVSGSGSFQSKYFSGYPVTATASGVTVQSSRLGQIAINIIDYVRAKESTNLIIQPIVGYFDTSQTDPTKTFVLNQNGSSTNGFSGLTRMPRVTEFGVWYGTNTGPTFTPPSPGSTIVQSLPITNGATYYVFKTEIFLPPNYGIASYNLTNLFIAIQGISGAANSITRWSPNYPIYKTDTHQIYSEEIDGSDPVIYPGQYKVITRAVGLGTNVPPASPPLRTDAGTKVVLTQQKLSSVLQNAPANDGLTNGLPVDTTTIDGMVSMEVDDPRLNQHPGDWVQVTRNSFGGRNSRWSAGTPPLSVVPEQDTDSGHISDVSLYMPPPKGVKFTRPDGTIDDNTAGRVQSVAELGFIPTGYETCAKFLGMNIPPGVPWRTLRFQPSASGTSVVPDWAIMDLFTAPISAPNQYNKYVYAPHDTSFGGRVNLNSKAEPFGLPRTTPLAAVLQNATYDFTDLTKKISSSTATTIADNIFNRTLATGGKQYGYAAGYDSPGEVVEMKGVADGGEKSEELVRQIANLVTARGNVFAVYTVGQAIRQTPSGKLTVTAEQRVQAMVERYQDSTNNTVRFAPVYFRNLSP